jgi:uncharacterized UPF0160 family protein
MFWATFNKKKHLKMSQGSIYKYLQTKCFVDQLNNTNEQALLKLLQSMNSHHNKIELQKDESFKIKFECAFKNQKLEV